MNHKIKMTDYKSELTILGDDEKEHMTKLYVRPNENKISLLERINAGKLRYIVDHADEYENLLVKSDSDEDWTLDRVLTILWKNLRKVKQGVVKVNYKQNDKQGRYFGEGHQSICLGLLGTPYLKNSITMWISKMPIQPSSLTTAKPKGLSIQTSTNTPLTEKRTSLYCKTSAVWTWSQLSPLC